MLLLSLINLFPGVNSSLTPRAKTALRPTTFSREPELMIRDLLDRSLFSYPLDQTHSV